MHNVPNGSAITVFVRHSPLSCPSGRTIRPLKRRDGEKRRALLILDSRVSRGMTGLLTGEGFEVRRMSRYVAFLRGMNLGRRRIKSPELCAAFEDIGFKNVAAYLASGNVIFDADDSDTDVVAGSIESGLRDSLGYEVPTFLRSSEEVMAIAGYAPFASVYRRAYRQVAGGDVRQ